MTWPSFNLVDPALNWAASFLYNPLFAPFASDAGEMEIQQLSYCYLLFCKIFFVVPIFIAAFLRFGRTTLATLICILASLFAVFVSDPFFWASLHALPAAAFLLVLAQSQRNREGYLLIGAACLWASTAGPLAVVGSLMLASPATLRLESSFCFSASRFHSLSFYSPRIRCLGIRVAQGSRYSHQRRFGHPRL